MTVTARRFASAPGSARERTCDHWRTIWERSWGLVDTLLHSSVRPSANSRLTKRIAWNNWNKLRRPLRWTSSFFIPVWFCRSFRPWSLRLKVPPEFDMAARSTCLNSARPPSCGYLPDKGNCWLSPAGWRVPYFNRKWYFRVNWLRLLQREPATHAKIIPLSC